jgi:Lrp/AsnC family transcriptional regulator, regulator for asnA, asnC and gidA
MKEDEEKFTIRFEQDLPEHKALVELDELDRDILQMLLKDVFFPYSDLAEKWGVTGATVRNRVKRLKSLGVMDAILVMNPYKIGYTTFAIIGVRLDTDADYNAVANALLAIPGVTNVMMVTGRYDFFVHYVCRNTEEYRKFLIDELRKIPGISAHESYIGLELYERKFELGVIG